MSNAMTAFRKLAKKAEESYERSFVSPEDLNKRQKIMFDSPQLTYLYSGFTLGRIQHYWGAESGGKSSLVAYMCGQLQKKVPEIYPDKQVVLWMDFERTFDPIFANRLGLQTDEDHFKLIHANCAEDAFQICEDLIKTEAVCAIVLDSDAALATKTQSENDIGKATFGATARFLADELRRINLLLSNYQCSYFQISQERANMNVMSHLPSVSGGYAIKFFASARNRVTKTEQIMKNGEPIGIQIRVRNYKLKTPGCVPWRDANMTLYFDGGFRPDDEYIEFIKQFSLINVAGGGNYSSEEFDFKCRGETKLIEHLNANPKVYDVLKQRVLKKLLQANELDVNNAPPPDDPDPDGSNYQSLAAEAASGSLPDYSHLEEEE